MTESTERSLEEIIKDNIDIDLDMEKRQVNITLSGVAAKVMSTTIIHYREGPA